MNLFMHYAFDTWMQRTSPNCPFARYADDAVVHCRSRKQAEYVMRSIASRLADCGLTVKPRKVKLSCGCCSVRLLSNLATPLPFKRPDSGLSDADRDGRYGERQST